MHDDVGDVAMDEDFAGEEAGDLVRRHAGIRAADPEIFGRLHVCELCEKLWFTGADFFRPRAVCGQEMIKVRHFILY